MIHGYTLLGQGRGFHTPVPIEKLLRKKIQSLSKQLALKFQSSFIDLSTKPQTLFIGLYRLHYFTLPDVGLIYN